LGYDGWINFDIFPTRMDAIESSRLSIDTTKKMIQFINEIDKQKMDRMIAEENVLEMQAYLWDQIFQK
jgi:hypothetical protein